MGARNTAGCRCCGISACSCSALPATLHGTFALPSYTYTPGVESAQGDRTSSTCSSNDTPVYVSGTLTFFDGPPITVRTGYPGTFFTVAKYWRSEILSAAGYYECECPPRREAVPGLPGTGPQAGACGVRYYFYCGTAGHFTVARQQYLTSSGGSSSSYPNDIVGPQDGGSGNTLVCSPFMWSGVAFNYGVGTPPPGAPRHTVTA